MSRKSLLAVLPVVPWPSRQNGVAIRYYPILEALSKHYDIDVIVLREAATSRSDDPLLTRLRSVSLNELGSRRSTLWDKVKTAMRVLSPWHAPYCQSSTHSDAAFELVNSAIQRDRHDTVLWVSGYCLDAMNRISRLRRGSMRFVHDSVDSGLLHYTRILRNPSLLRRLDLAKLRYWEKRLHKHVDELIYISRADARAAGERRSSVIPNGIQTSDFVDGPPIENTIGFLGAMDYPPNVEAALRLHEEVFKPLAQRHPNLRLRIIGRAPTEAIRRLETGNVTITGAVDNIWTEITKVSVFVFPMVSGAGLQNKILESMYASRPVVTTQICNDSLEARDGEQIICSTSNAELIAATDRLLADSALRHKIGAQGRAFVERKFAMDAVIQAFDSALFPDVAR